VAYEIPSHEPKQAQAGSSWFWDASYPTFPATDGWALAYYLRGPVDKDFTWGTHVTADGAGYSVRVPASLTDDLTAAGPYQLTGRVSLDGVVHVVYSAALHVLADPLQSVNAKTFNRRMLEALETAMAAGAATGSEVLSISINGRSITYRDRAEMTSVHAHYRLLVAIEENPLGSLTHAAEFVRG
jgi:hypothetical protein